MAHVHSSSSSTTSTSDTMMSMSMMESVFFTSTSTSLYSSAWTPKTIGAYAGTCIFLILLAFIFRSLAAGKQLLEHRWMDKELNRRYISVRGVPTEAQRISTDSESKNVTLISERGVEEHVRIVRRHKRNITPWRFSIDLPRAAYVTVMTGVGYLLMLAVMTFNVGYFLSILAGTFLGEISFGRYAALDEH